MSCFSGFTEVFNHLVIVRLHAVAFLVAEGNMEEGVRFSLVGRFLEPSKGLTIILSDSNALEVTIGEKGLAIGLTCLSSHSIISYCLHYIFLHP